MRFAASEGLTIKGDLTMPYTVMIVDRYWGTRGHRRRLPLLCPHCDRASVFRLRQGPHAAIADGQLVPGQIQRPGAAEPFALRVSLICVNVLLCGLVDLCAQNGCYPTEWLDGQVQAEHDTFQLNVHTQEADYTSRWWLDGEYKSQRQSGCRPPGTLALGRAGYTDEGSDFDVACVLTWNRVLKDDERKVCRLQNHPVSRRSSTDRDFFLCSCSMSVAAC